MATAARASSPTSTEERADRACPAMKIAVLGAGAWGTALAVAAAPRHDVLLWARDAAQAAAMQQQRVNARYLDGVPLPEALQVTADHAAAAAHAAVGLCVIATPMAGLREQLQ